MGVGRQGEGGCSESDWIRYNYASSPLTRPSQPHLMVCPVRVASLVMDGYFHTMIWFWLYLNARKWQGAKQV